MLKRIRIRKYERGLLYREREFVGVLRPGLYRRFDPLGRLRVDVVRVRDTWLARSDLDEIVKSGALAEELRVIDLDEHQRAIVWFDDRIDTVLGPGLYAAWSTFRRVRVEIVDARAVKFEHVSLPAILQADSANALSRYDVEPGHVGLCYHNGSLLETLGPGVHAFWRGVGRIAVEPVDMRERVEDIAGQDIMTADKVTLRLNAVVAYRVRDPRVASTAVDDVRQTLYRDAQLALRAVVTGRELDDLLSRKDDVAEALATALTARAAKYGVDVASVGIRDVILPGDMKTLLNRVTEAKKAAEANLITRREETAAIRSQLNTAKMLESNPTLMRLRELEVLEKVAGKANLSVLLGDSSLADKVTKLV